MRELRNRLGILKLGNSAKVSWDCSQISTLDATLMITGLLRVRIRVGLLRRVLWWVKRRRLLVVNARFVDGLRLLVLGVYLNVGLRRRLLLLLGRGLVLAIGDVLVVGRVLLLVYLTRDLADGVVKGDARVLRG